MKTPLFRLVVLLVGLNACKTTSSGGGGPLPSPEAALQGLRVPGQARRSLRASGRLTYYGDKGRVRVRTILLAQRPAAFRVETVSPFDQPLEVMACDGDRVSFMSEGRLYAGRANRRSLSRLLPLALAPEELVDLLLGGVPSGPGFQAEDIAWDGDRWRLIVRRLGTEQRAQLWVAPGEQQVTRLRWLESDGSQRLDVRFERFKAVEGAGQLPHRIIAQVPGEQGEVRIRLLSIDVNAALNPGLFTIQPPSGQPVEPL